MHRKVLSLLLVFCLLLGMIPFGGSVLAAGSDTPIPYTAHDQETLLSALSQIQESGDSVSKHEILITNGFSLDKTIVFPKDRNIILRGEAEPLHIISADGELLKTGGSMFVVPDYATPTDKRIQIYGLELDACAPADKTVNIRIISVGANADLLLGISGIKTILRGAYVSGASNGGAAVYAGMGSKVYAFYTDFLNNVAEPKTGSGGGAIYLFCAAGHFRECQFDQNQANSGGAIYFYGGTGLPLVVDTCSFTGNVADQRGGAIHCHGNAVVCETTFKANISNQNGGAIFISAQSEEGGVKGKLILQDSKVVGNTSGGNGGGIYIADTGTLYFAGSRTTVAGNEINDTKIPVDYRKSNVFYTGPGCKIIAGSSVMPRGLDGAGGVGISTTNAYGRKLAVYSARNVADSEEMDALETLLESIHDLGWERDIPIRLSKTYSMADAENNKDYKNFFYDSAVWRLVTKKFDTNDQELRDLFDVSPEPITDPNAKEGNMWLNLDPEYIRRSTGGTTTVTVNAPCVIFDHNLPGAKADIFDNLEVGKTVSIPTISSETQKGVQFIFKGWYDQPVEGTKLTQPITVTKDMGIKIYYAQWDIIPPDPVPGPIPGVEQMYLAYFYLNYEGGGFTSSYIVAGDFTFTVHYTTPAGSGSKEIPVKIPWSWPGRPYRRGYDFAGWSLEQNGATVNTATWTPTQLVTTFYAQWSPQSCDITWDANKGEWKNGETSSKKADVKLPYDSIVKLPDPAPTREGYKFTGWYLDADGATELASDAKVLNLDNAVTYYAGWDPLEYTITWDANYTGGGITTVTQYHDQPLKIPADPIRHGYKFNGWLEKDDNIYAAPEDTVTGSKTYIAQWGENQITYTVTVDWSDFNDNDAIRPESITITLMQNGIPMKGNRFTQTIDATMAVEGNANQWTYDFKNLPETDVVSNPITYSVAITSSVPDEYVYRVENRSETAGYILLTHSLITRDVDAYVVWEDNNDQDGHRPATVTLQLGVADDSTEGYHAVLGSASRVTLSGSGNTWFYRFHVVQKYYTDKDGNKGVEIPYIIAADPTNSGELEGYTDDYHDYTHIFHYTTATVNKKVIVEWQDDINKDGKRPAIMMVQLYADNVPLEGKTMALSDTNGWTYTWDKLPKYTDGGREVVYSARVTSTLVDYTAKSTGMTIEMTYVPSTTSISAFVTWTDENDADGLRPDYVMAELVADTKPTGDKQVLSATNGWTTTWNNYPIYKNGERIEYTFRINPKPEEYGVRYKGVYDTSGLSAILSHDRITQSLTGKIVWEDRDNQSGARMGEVTVLLCADGQVIDERQRVTINADTDWEHVFAGLNKYRDHGEEIRYSIILVSSAGQYAATTNGMTITMNLNPEYVDVPFEVIWNDNNDSDGVRPHEVKAVLLVDGQPSGKTQLITAKTDWATVFTHLDYSGPSGVYRYKVELDEVPEGYDAKEADNAVVLKRVAETKNVTATVIWQDNSDQYAQRPKQVTLTLYADYLDGNGPQNTGIVEKCKATDGWEHIFENVPVLHNGKRIVYSVKASGDLTNYTMLEDGMDVYMKHKGYDPGDVTTEYVATVIWHNNYHNNPEKPTEVTLVLQDSQGKTYKRIVTKASADTTGYTWWYTFSNLPTFQGSTPLTYELSVEAPQGYIAKIMGQTIILTQVKDIPVRVDWYDEGCDLSVRPESLELYLRANDGDTQTSITLRNEDPDNEPWHGTFMDCPVWVDGESEEPINYTWIFSNADLEAVGYTAAYDYSEGVEEDGKTVYPIDLTRAGEEMTVPITIVWNDEGDQDGVRPEAVKLNLYGENTDISQTVTTNGNNTDKNWHTTSMAVPVRRDHTLVGYTAEVTEAKDANGQNVLTHYLAEIITEGTGKNQAITITMTHTPETQERESTIIWADETKEGGLTRFPITIELVANNQVLKTKTVSIEESKGQSKVTVRWDDVPVCYDHGKVYKDFTVRATAAEDKPADHVIREEGLDVTVKLVQFHLTGCVYNDDKVPIPTALINLWDLSNGKFIQTFTDSSGCYSFTVAPGSYTVYANVYSLLNGGSASETVYNLNCDKNVDLTLSGKVYCCECMIEVVDSMDRPAPYAEVALARLKQGYITTLTMNEEGKRTVTLPSSTYDFSVTYTYKGVRYRAPLDTRNITGIGPDKIETIKIIVPVADTNTKEISGNVVDKAGKPVSGVSVYCSRRENGDVWGVEANTDENGIFKLKGLSDGTYELFVTDQTGKELVLSSPVAFTIPNDTWLNVKLLDSGSQSSTPSGHGTLTGVVTDKSGQPMDNAQVVVMDKTTGATASVLTTDSNGVFETQLPAGEYTVDIRELFDNTTDLPIRVNDDAASREDGPVTADSFTISGEVLDEDGQPKEGVTVYLYGEDGQLVLVNVMESEVEEPAPAEDEGEGIMEAMVSGVLEAMEDVEDAMIAKVEEVLAEIAPDEADEGEADTDQDADEPMEYDTVSLTDSGYVRMDETVTAEDGKYIFAGLPAGRYVVKIAEGIGGNGGSTDIPVVAGPLPEIPDDADLTITTDSYTVSGVVENRDGALVNGAKVTLLDEQGKEVARLTTGKDGTYQFESLAEGDYTVNISYPDSELLASGDVTISDGSFATFPGQLVTGAVKDNKGNALPNMIVTLTDEANHTYTATTDKDGGYRVVVPDGKYTVEINVNGKTASKAITVNGKPVSADLTVTISTDTTPGGTTPSGSGGSGSGGSGGSGGGMGGGSVEEQPKTVLSGVVTDKDGNGVEGATVTAVDTKTGETYTATTGPDGKYTLAVPKGSYTITITYGSISSNPKQVTASKDTTLASMTLDNLGKLVHSYVTGYSDGTFGGDRHISRSEVAALISRVSSGFDASKTYPCQFKDVADGVWYANNLGYCVEAGLIQGRGNGHFDPTANITRAEFAAIVARFLGLPNEVGDVKVSYPDTEGNWAEGYIAQLTAKGIVQGKGDGKFDPDANITRYEAVTMLNRALERTPDKAVLDALAANRTIRVFSDLDATHWAYYQVLEAANDHYHK